MKNKTKTFALATLTTLTLLGLNTPAHAQPSPTNLPPAAKKYANCAELNKTYKHGIAKNRNAKDKTTGRKVTNFQVSYNIYMKNTHLDRDKDNIACEKR